MAGEKRDDDERMFFEQEDVEVHSHFLPQASNPSFRVAFCPKARVSNNGFGKEKTVLDNFDSIPFPHFLLLHPTTGRDPFSERKKQGIIKEKATKQEIIREKATDLSSPPAIDR